MGTARKELGGLLRHEHLDGVPVLVFANKQDLRDAMTAAELSAALALPDIKARRICTILRVCLTPCAWIPSSVHFGCGTCMPHL